MQILLDMTKPWLGKVGALFIQKEDASFRHTLIHFFLSQLKTKTLRETFYITFYSLV